jgi:stage V sporulation protein AE
MDYIKAFVVGGSMCLVGQIFVDKTKVTSGRIVVYLVVIGAILSGIGIYKPFVEFAGAGATVPITGFGHLLSEGVKDAVDEKGFLGIFTGGFTSASAGLASVVFFSLISALIFEPKEK